MTGNSRHSGRNKTLYETYECSNRKRTKQCDMRAINKSLAEKIVIDALYDNIFSKKAIENLIRKILTYAQEQNKTITEDIITYKKELKDVDSKIDNIVEAIADGLYNPVMKEKLTSLESKKNALLIRIDEAEREAILTSPSKEMIKKYLSKDSDIKEKTPQQQKKVVQNYIKKVTIYDDEVITDTIVTCLGIGESYQTRIPPNYKSSISINISKNFNTTIAEFIIYIPLTTLTLLQAFINPAYKIICAVSCTFSCSMRLTPNCCKINTFYSIIILKCKF